MLIVVFRTCLERGRRSEKIFLNFLSQVQRSKVFLGRIFRIERGKCFRNSSDLLANLKVFIGWKSSWKVSSFEGIFPSEVAISKKRLQVWRRRGTEIWQAVQDRWLALRSIAIEEARWKEWLQETAKLAIVTMRTWEYWSFHIEPEQESSVAVRTAKIKYLEGEGLWKQWVFWREYILFWARVIRHTS